MSFSQTLDFPYSTGGTSTGASANLVPALYPVALGGHPYLLDDGAEFGKAHTHQSIPYLRPYFATQDQVNSKALNPEALWRRSADSWHKGAGQRHFDRDDSDPNRFWASKGVDIWTKWQLSLLPHTTKALTDGADTNPLIAVAGANLYVSTSPVRLKRTTNLTGFTDCTGLPTAITALASDGNRVYIAAGTQGIYSTTALACTVWQAGTFDLVAYVKSRVMAASGPNLYNIVTPDPLLPPASPLFAHPNPSWVWTAFAEGDAAIYAAGSAGDKSAIFRIGIKTDGTGLDAPIHAGSLPSSEIVYAIYGYLGFLFIGTNRGVRFAVQQQSGQLSIGALIETPGPVRCFDGQRKFVYFGWENYDTLSTGLGRLNPEIINDGAPAYASDLMAAGQGPVTALGYFLGRTVFGVAGSGFWVQHATNVVPSGTLDSGLIGYDIADTKIALSVEVGQRTPAAGSYSVALSSDLGPFQDLGTRSTASLVAPFDARQTRAEQLELRIGLTRDSGATKGPLVARYTLFSIPDVRSGMFITVPFLLAESLMVKGRERKTDPQTEYEFLTGLRDSKQLVPYQEGRLAWTVVMDDYEWHPKGFSGLGFSNGTFVAKLKTIT